MRENIGYVWLINSKEKVIVVTLTEHLFQIDMFTAEKLIITSITELLFQIDHVYC